VGLTSGTVADAKKKGKKKGKSGTVTVSKTTPTSLAPAAPGGNDSLTVVPLTVGKKAKGKVVGWDSLTVTTTFSAPTTPALGTIFASISAPNGRTVSLFNPEASSLAANTTSGPLTETPDSPFSTCFPDPSNPCPGGNAQDPEATVGPPYAGTIGTLDLAQFGGVPARGTWSLLLTNGSSTATSTLNSASITMTLKNAPV
jgi:hypothetical protein